VCRTIVGLAFILLVLSVSRPAAAESVTDLYYRCCSSTVAIEIRLDDDSVVYGTGSIISDNGHVLTCAHLIPSTKRVRHIVVALDEASFSGTVVWRSSTDDLMLLEVRELKNRVPLRPIGIEGLKVGMKVYTLSYPIGIDGSRDLVVSQCRVSTEPSGRVVNLEASIGDGSSGAPVVTQAGELVGVITGRSESSGRAALMTYVSNFPDAVRGYVQTTSTLEGDMDLNPLEAGRTMKYRLTTVEEDGHVENLGSMICRVEGPIDHEGRPCYIMASTYPGGEESRIYVAARSDGQYLLGTEKAGFLPEPQLFIPNPMKPGQSWLGAIACVDNRPLVCKMTYVGVEDLDAANGNWSDCRRISASSESMSGDFYYAKGVGIVLMRMILTDPNGRKVRANAVLER